ncbi:MAG: hypothetical protein M1839_007076 [Geoglossum umbratile]|nr:MAG: hypothetical protein M1839_007076 [Geoglossum umbratile]
MSESGSESKEAFEARWLQDIEIATQEKQMAFTALLAAGNTNVSSHRTAYFAYDTAAKHLEALENTQEVERQVQYGADAVYRQPNSRTAVGEERQGKKGKGAAAVLAAVSCNCGPRSACENGRCPCHAAGQRCGLQCRRGCHHKCKNYEEGKESASPFAIV